jgi:hypothetical protein
MSRRRSPGVFCGFWTDPQTGRRVGKLTRAELAPCYRLRARHRDILNGKPRPT